MWLVPGLSKVPNADIYFIANTSNVTVHAMARLRSSFHSVVWLDPYNGKAIKAINHHGQWSLHLPPYGSAILLLHNGSLPAAAPRRSHQLEQQIANLNQDWRVDFPALHLQRVLPSLVSWTENPKTLYYSGTAIYHRNFSISSGELRHGQIFLSFGHGKPIPKPLHPVHMGTQAWFDPPIQVAAIVSVNGHRAGALWHPPYKLNLTTLLKPGTNHIEVRVANTAINEMAGKSLPNYRLLWMRYGRRFTPQQMNLVHPLPSGLLGNVTLLRRSQP